MTKECEKTVNELVMYLNCTGRKAHIWSEAGAFPGTAPEEAETRVAVSVGSTHYGYLAICGDGDIVLDGWTGGCSSLDTIDSARRRMKIELTFLEEHLGIAICMEWC